MALIKRLGPRKTAPVLKALDTFLETGEESKLERAVNKIIPRLSLEDQSILYGMIIAEYIEDLSQAARERLREIVDGFIPEMDDLRVRNLVCGICIQWEAGS
jgi:hypothetical protein